MWPNCGCGLTVAVVVFGLTLVVQLVIGVIYPPFRAETGLATQAALAGMLAGNVGLAFFLLMLRDTWRERAVLRRVRGKLLARDEAASTQPAAGTDGDDPPLLLQTRQALAERFDVPVAAIRPDDRLDRDYAAASLEPGLQTFVVMRVAELCGVSPLSYVFQPDTEVTVRDLAGEVAGVLEGWAIAGADSGERKEPEPGED